VRERRGGALSHAKRRIEEEMENEWMEYARRKAEEILRLMDEGYTRSDVVHLLRVLATDIETDEIHK
jgi:hypothetical protein